MKNLISFRRSEEYFFVSVIDDFEDSEIPVDRKIVETIECRNVCTFDIEMKFIFERINFEFLWSTYFFVDCWPSLFDINDV